MHKKRAITPILETGYVCAYDLERSPRKGEPARAEESRPLAETSEVPPSLPLFLKRSSLILLAYISLGKTMRAHSFLQLSRARPVTYTPVNSNSLDINE